MSMLAQVLERGSKMQLSSDFGGVKLGNKVRCRLSGLEGTADNFVWMTSGTRQISIQPLGDGKEVPKGVSSDFQLVEVMDEGMEKVATEPEDMTSLLGFYVENGLTGSKGLVIQQVLFINGCMYATIQPKRGTLSSVVPDTEFVSVKHLTVLRGTSEPRNVDKPAPEPVRRPPGGPMQPSRRAC